MLLGAAEYQRAPKNKKYEQSFYSSREITNRKFGPTPSCLFYMFLQILLDHESKQFRGVVTFDGLVGSGLISSGKISSPSSTGLRGRGRSGRRHWFQRSQWQMVVGHIVSDIREFIESDANICNLITFDVKLNTNIKLTTNSHIYWRT